MVDHCFEVQRFDRGVGATPRQLEGAGELDYTTVVMTGDHGVRSPGTSASDTILAPKIFESSAAVIGLICIRIDAGQEAGNKRLGHSWIFIDAIKLRPDGKWLSSRWKLNVGFAIPR